MLELAWWQISTFMIHISNQKIYFKINVFRKIMILCNRTRYLLSLLSKSLNYSLKADTTFDLSKKKNNIHDNQSVVTSSVKTICWWLHNCHLNQRISYTVVVHFHTCWYIGGYFARIDCCRLLQLLRKLIDQHQGYYRAHKDCKFLCSLLSQ